MAPTPYSSEDINNFSCPLCGWGNADYYHADHRRTYLQCLQCKLVFVPPDQRLSPAQEKEEYDLHENDPNDCRYRRFLSRVFDPICAKIPPPARGLDFGCGPGPALQQMFLSAGYDVAVYDIFYSPNKSVLDNKYDFISCTEVVEHLHKPKEIFDLLFSMLVPGGWLGIMTKLVIDSNAFAYWHYKNDPTHVCFFSKTTFSWLAQLYQYRLEYAGNDVILLQKSS